MDYIRSAAALFSAGRAAIRCDVGGAGCFSGFADIADSFAWSRISFGQLAERQLRFLIRQRKADKHILAAELAPQCVRRPLLRLGPARALNPDKVPLGHQQRPETNALPVTWQCGNQRLVDQIDSASYGQHQIRRPIDDRPITSRCHLLSSK
jgi:hypothetical protein